MSIWRPPQEIRVKAIGLHWRGMRLLAAEVLDDCGELKGVRPIGGTVEFGETLTEAMIREFREELGVRAAPTGSPLFFENIYMHEGVCGHEIVAAFDVMIAERNFEGLDRIEFRESDGSPVVARWFDLDELDHEGYPALYPSGLKDRLLT